jgi:Ca2+-binding RTX toxin-like protein
MKRARHNGHFDTCCCSGCVGDSAISAPPPDDGGGGTTPAPKPYYSRAQIIEQLTTSWGEAYEGTSWTWSGGTIRYSIANGVTSPNDFGGPESEGYDRAMMTAYKTEMAVLAFELWDDLIAVDMNRTTATSGNIITMAYSGTTNENGTYADPELSGTGDTWTFTADRIWLSTRWRTHDEDSDIQYSTYGFTTYLHEIGHALGLSHAGTYDASDDEPITYATHAEYAQDTRQNTIMSYFGGWTDSSGVTDTPADGVWSFIKDGDRALYADGSTRDLYAATPMVDDIAAIQAKYGADTTTRDGATTYGFHATAGRDVYDFDVNLRPIFSIWDGGGIDTLDASGFSQNQVIHLVPGAYSSIGALLGNIGIAYNCIIENAVGGSGNDTMFGNGAGNRLTGGGGIDTIYGYDGFDWIDGGAGADRMHGGLLGDTFIVDDSGDQIFESAGGGTDLAYVGASYYVLGANVENATITRAAGTTLYGNGSANTIAGNLGVDHLSGGADNDTLYGYGSNDVLDGGLGADTLFGGGNYDTFVMKRGEANGDVLMDFNGNGGGAGDMIRFSGYGPGAYLSTFDGTLCAVRTADGAVADIFTVRSGIPIHGSDYYFV